MIVADSSAWIEILADGPNADVFASRIAEAESIIIPTVVLYEVHKVVTRQLGEEAAAEASAELAQNEVVSLSASLALAAAETSLEHSLAMADAIIYTTAQLHSATLVTGDAHFDGLPGVEYIPAPSVSSGRADL